MGYRPYFGFSLQVVALTRAIGSSSSMSMMSWINLFAMVFDPTETTYEIDALVKSCQNFLFSRQIKGLPLSHFIRVSNCPKYNRKVEVGSKTSKKNLKKSMLAG